MTEQMQTDFNEGVVVPNIDEIKTIPEEELQEFDIGAKEMRFEDEVFYEMGDSPAEVEDTEEELPTAPKTHGIEDAIDGTLEEV